MSDATRSYSAYWYRLDETNRYLIWYESNTSSWEDGVYLNETGHAPTFGTLPEIQAFSASIGIALGPLDPLLDNLDVVAHWLTNPVPDGIDCIEFLTAWNLFGDVAHSVGAYFAGDTDESTPVYDKLFWGNNHPSMTPPGEHYIPAWNDEETRQIAEILQSGLTLFRTVVAP